MRTGCSLTYLYGNILSRGDLICKILVYMARFVVKPDENVRTSSFVSSLRVRSQVDCARLAEEALKKMQKLGYFQFSL